MTRYERAARAYCVNRGLDPDENIQFRHPQGFAVVCKTSRYKLIAEELEDFDERLNCLNEITE